MQKHTIRDLDFLIQDIFYHISKYKVIDTVAVLNEVCQKNLGLYSVQKENYTFLNIEIDFTSRIVL